MSIFSVYSVEQTAAF